MRVHPSVDDSLAPSTGLLAPTLSSFEPCRRFGPEIELSYCPVLRDKHIEMQQILCIHVRVGGKRKALRVYPPSHFSTVQAVWICNNCIMLGVGGTRKALRVYPPLSTESLTH